MTFLLLSGHGIAIIRDGGTAAPPVLYYPKGRRQLNVLVGRKQPGVSAREFRLQHQGPGMATYEEVNR